MIVQSATSDQPHFIVTMAEHSGFAGKLARVFGNTDFEGITPLTEMLYLIDHHDRGWFELDANPCVNPQTGLPWHLSNTPSALKVTTMMKSVDFNQAHHLYCGLLAAMHMWGIYHGRYGLSERALVSDIPNKFKVLFNEQFRLLAQRQTLLMAQLNQQPTTLYWLQRHLWQNYKQLQFFDTLALYFNGTCEQERQSLSLVQVPITATETTTVTIKSLKGNQYLMTPFPFNEPVITLSFKGQYLMPAKRDQHALLEALALAPVAAQVVHIVSEEMSE
ncbi:DUF3891 family protein [Shewanella surugensis]|uniref:DUF3891 family protein n=1 Tax=Shewanella surugensis TaxID=212020 RepID=A0ABT0L7T6_9GAMM|nr:DUF3891 family protein [Shewanella surugensis]MCL1123231.1 DUF3891 family protein [Shewanella surugensis]